MAAMFNTPLSQIDFPMIEEFCKNWSEGVRVEFKKNLNVDFPKTVSSFANTLGGILLLGVETHKGTNKAVLPIAGFPLEANIEERITQSSYQGIYPPVIPALRIFPLPSNPQNVVVVIKVAESIEAPHAIQNKRKTYARVNSTSDPYDLAEIDRIEYWINRRRDPEIRREKLIEAAFARSRVHTARIRIAICPRYPHRHLHTGDSLKDKIELLSRNHKFSFLVRDQRRIQGGFITAGNVVPHHLELNLYGGIFFDEPLDTARLPEKSSPPDTKELAVTYVHIVSIVRPLGMLLRAAEIILDNTTTNLLIRVVLEGVEGHGIRPADNLIDPRRFIQEHRAIQNVISGEIDVIRETAKEQFSEIIVELVRQLMWSFDWDDDDFIKNRTLEILRSNTLV